MADNKKKNENLRWVAGSVALVVGIFVLAFVFHGGAPKPAPQVAKPTTSADAQPGQNGIQMGGIPQGSFGPLYQRRVASEIGQNFKKLEAKQQAKMVALQKQQNDQAQKTASILNSIQQQQQQLQQEITTENRRRNEESQGIQYNQMGQPGAGLHHSRFSETPQQAMGASQPLNAATNKSNKLSPVIASDGFVKGTLLNGVVASGGAGASGLSGAGTTFALVNVTGTYHAANGFSSDLKNCFVQTQAFPDFASSRVLLKPTKLSCNMPDGQTKNWSVAGWVVGQDGIEGVKGKVNENLGNQVAASALLGALSGAASTVNQGQYTTTYSPNSGGASILTGNPYTSALAGVAQGGAQAGSTALQQYFALYAPSIQVGANTHLTVVITNTIPLPESGAMLTTNFKKG